MKKDDVWQCSCGENSFLLQRDGTVFCDACDQVAEPVKVAYENPNTKLTGGPDESLTEEVKP